MQLFAQVTVESTHCGQVVVLTSVSVGNYVSAVPPGDLPSCFLHSLATRSFSDVPVAPRLVQPNLIAGLPAQGTVHLTLSCFSVNYGNHDYTQLSISYVTRS